MNCYFRFIYIYIYIPWIKSINLVGAFKVNIKSSTIQALVQLAMEKMKGNQRKVFLCIFIPLFILCSFAIMHWKRTKVSRSWWQKKIENHGWTNPFFLYLTLALVKHTNQLYLTFHFYLLQIIILFRSFEWNHRRVKDDYNFDGSKEQREC